MTFVIGVANLSHCVSTTFEVLAGVISGPVTVTRLFVWLGSVTFGNIAGGVMIGALLNYGQVRVGEE